MSRYGPDRDANLGPVQKHVLLVLSTRGESACNDWAAWYPIDTSQVYSAIQGLGRRGLVDVAGFNGRARTYKITDEGERVADRLAAEGSPFAEEDE